MTDNIKRAAEQARLQAYAPYSGFCVGAALSCASGDVVTGCNVENVSLGLTICAERACVAKAIDGGNREFVELAIVADTVDPVVPCGACRQVLAEFAPDLVITTWTLNGQSQTFALGELLPLPTQGILQVPRGT